MLRSKKKGKSKAPIEREGIKTENPNDYYEFGEEIGRGKFGVVRYATSKTTGEKYAAKSIYYDSETLKFAIREFDLMNNEKFRKSEGLVQLHEAFLVRKYLILIIDLCDGKTLLDQVAKRRTYSEYDVTDIIRQLCEILGPLHLDNFVHLDLRPTNIRFSNSREVKILDYNSCRKMANKKAGEVVDVIGDTEFCAPEMLSFDRVSSKSDMWTVGVIAYILLSGISPFYNENEDLVVSNVQNATWSFDELAFAGISKEAQEFIKSCFKKHPDMRPTAESALGHPWLAEKDTSQDVDVKNQKEAESARKRSTLDCMDQIEETHNRLLEEVSTATVLQRYLQEEEEYIIASLVFRTFDEEEYDSPDESDEE